MIKVKNRKILLLPGDGIGPEVIREVRKIIEWFNKNKSLDFKIEEGLVGGASYEKHKNPITFALMGAHSCLRLVKPARYAKAVILLFCRLARCCKLVKG